MTTPTERVHHPFSPSTLGALEVCPSYQGRNELSVAAETGTRLHAVAETGQDDNELSDDAVSMAAAAMDFVARQRTLLSEAAQRAGSGQPILELSEQYLPVDAEETTAGYADVCLIAHDRKSAVIVDYKFGAWAVEDAKSNAQGIAYALGLFYKFPSLDSVAVYFFQPALDHVTTATFFRSDVPLLYLRVKTIVEKAKLARSLGDFSTAKATVPTCQFCANIARCPRVSELVIQVAQKFYPAALPADLDAHALSDPAQTAIGLRLANIVTVWSEAFKKACNDRVLRGVVPPPEGYELTSRAERAIINPDTFRAVALSVLTSAEFDATLDIRLGAVEKAVSSKAPRGSKTAAVEDFKQKLLDNGAVKMGQPYSFLKAIPPKKNQTETTEKIES